MPPRPVPVPARGTGTVATTSGTTPATYTAAGAIRTPTAALGQVARQLAGWPRDHVSDAWRYSLLVYLATRVPVVIGALIARFLHPGSPASSLADRWDTWWYERIARFGYTTTLHPGATGMHGRYSEWAFFPSFPLAIRLVHLVTRQGMLVSGILLVAVTGLLAVRAVLALGTAVAGRDAGRAAALLFAAWPGSVVLSLVYSEGLFLTMAALALLLLRRRRWVLAGLAGMVATATRPNGVAVLAAAVVAAAAAIWSRREWRSLLAPVLAAFGVLGFFGYAWLRTGHPLEWLRAEALWHQRLDLSLHLPEVLGHLLRVFGGAASPEVFLELVGAGAVVPMVVLLMTRWRQIPLPWIAYLLVNLALIFGSSQVGPRPRMVLALLPGFTLMADAFRPQVTTLVAVSFASLLALTTLLYVGFSSVGP